MRPMTTFTIQFCEQGATSWDYLEGVDRAQVRRVFARLHPKARILVVREN
jgi:hypothetical protein